MAKTYADVISEARALLVDNTVPYRYTDSLLIDKLNRGLQELARLRPDAFWDTFSVDDVVVPEVTDGTLTSVFPIPMQFYTPVVYFVVASAELVDDEFTADGRAMTLMSAFRQSVISL
jgi:hypothetical protein